MAGPLEAAETLLKGFDRHYALFRYNAQQAKHRFEAGDYKEFGILPVSASPSMTPEFARPLTRCGRSFPMTSRRQEPSGKT